MKIKITIAIFALSYLLVSCNSEATKTVEIHEINQNEAVSAESYDLMKQKCFVCHMEKPSFEKKASMLAPPMIKIKEHYIPTFQNKSDFVDALVDFVTDPKKEKIMMPGAVRRFKIMPNLGLNKEDVAIIAAAIYDTDFEAMPKMKKSQASKLSLNNGNKWKLKKESIDEIERINNELKDFSSNDIADYALLAKSVFGGVRKVLLDSDYNDEIVNQLHYFFGATEGSIHKLQSTKSLEEAKEIVAKLKTQFLMFNEYFE